MLSRLRCGVTRGALSVQTLCTKRLITQSSLTVLYRNKIPTASMKPVQTSYLHARSFNACTRLRQSDYVQKGNEHIEAGRAKEAIECYVDAVAEGGESADLLYNLGNAYCQAGVRRYYLLLQFVFAVCDVNSLLLTRSLAHIH